MKIAIHDYSSTWDTSFQAERQHLSVAMSPIEGCIEHIGSTSVAGLAAKPVIDIMIGVAHESELDELISPIARLGYDYLPEYETMIPFRRFFRRSGDAGISFHLHAVVKGTGFWRDHLLFRDLLRNDNDLLTAYETLKKQLAEREWASGNDYAAAKSGFIKDALVRGRVSLSTDTGRVVYHVSTVLLETGELLRPYYLQRYADMIAATMEAIVSGRETLLSHCQADAWQRLEIPQEFPLLEPGQLKMMIVLEALFEQMRRDEAPHLPSRLASIFTWPELEQAQSFREAYFPKGVVHRCVIRSGSALAFDGALLPPGINLDVTDSSSLAEEVNRVRQRALRYWQRPHEPEFPELLVIGTVEVIGREDSGN